MTDNRLLHRYGIYAHRGHQLILMHSEAVDGRWEVYFGAVYLGVVSEVQPEEKSSWPSYQARLPDDEDVEGDDATDDWRSGVELLADEAGYFSSF